jgi:hypothetical protein
MIQEMSPLIGLELQNCRGTKVQSGRGTKGQSFTMITVVRFFCHEFHEFALILS